MPAKTRSKYASVYNTLRDQHRVEIEFPILTQIDLGERIAFLEVQTTMNAMRAWARREDRRIIQRWHKNEQKLVVELLD